MGGPTRPRLPGTHHITAICGDPQHDVDINTGLLRLGLVNRTVTFDDPVSYPLYYGDGLCTQGTILARLPELRLRCAAH